MKSIFILLTLITVTCFAQKPCEKDPVYNQFDFWIGEWNVYDANDKLVGTSKVSEILDNCVVLEEWLSVNNQKGLVYSGKSFNSYNSITKQWQQNWVDNIGGTTEYLTGVLSGNEMQFISRPFLVGNIKNIRRLTFYKLNNGFVSQFGEISTDEGKTWTIEFDFEYREK